MGRPSNTAARRAQIVSALARVMGRGGYAGATIQAIAREAGLQPGLVHYHFGSKEEILLALVARLESTVRARYQARAAAAPDARRRLHALIDAYLELGPDSDVAAVGAWNAIGAQALGDAQVARPFRRALARTRVELDRLVRAARRAEGRPERGHAEVAAALLCAIEGALRVGSLAPLVVPRGSAATIVRRMADGLVSAAP